MTAASWCNAWPIIIIFRGLRWSGSYATWTPRTITSTAPVDATAYKLTTASASAATALLTTTEAIAVAIKSPYFFSTQRLSGCYWLSAR